MIRIPVRSAPLGLVGALLLLTCGIAQAQNASLALAPADGPFDLTPAFGVSAAISGRTAVVGAPGFVPLDTSGNPPPYVGIVNVYTTDVHHTAWTLTDVLHAEDAAQADFYFGSGLALQGKRLIVSGGTTIWIYEKRAQGYVLLDKISATADPSGPLIYQDGVLAFRELTSNEPDRVLVFRVNDRGKAHLVSTLSAPIAAANFGGLTGEIAFDSSDGTFAIGGQNGTLEDPGEVYFYSRHGDQWTYKETLPAPSAAAAGFGSGVTLWHDKLVVGAPYEDAVNDVNADLTVNAGAVHVYRRENDQWVETQKISTVDPTSPVAGLVTFGAAMVTNGRYVWITAPQPNDNHASFVRAGYSSLFRWDEGQLVIFQPEAHFTSGGGLDMSRRYVIEGYGDQNFGESAIIEDLSLLQGSDTSSAVDSADESD